MYIHSKGIILRTIKYSESSMILDMYTLQRGRRSFIISGIRSKQSKTKAGLMQVMGLVDMVSYNKESTSLIRIKEIKADYLYQKIPFDVLRSCMGMFMMEICTKSIKETETNPQLFDFLRGSLMRLDQLEIQKLALFHIQFLLGLSKHLGIAIQNNYDDQLPYMSIKDGGFSNRDLGPKLSLNQSCSHALSLIIKKEKVKVAKSQRDQILDGLILYFRYHLEDFGNIRSLEVLRSIFS